jgi:hypothetical protein
MRRNSIRRTVVISSIAAGLAASTLAALPAQADHSEFFSFRRPNCQRLNKWQRDLKVVGLTADQKLVCFEDDSPGRSSRIGTVSGLTMDTKLVGIDFRPANGVLYGLGDAGGVYTLDLGSAEATLRSRLTEALSGTSFGVDFNPTVDRLRIVSDTGQNLRANVDTGAASPPDGNLNYVGPPPVTPAQGVSAVAYTNNDADPNTATTLFDIDANLDQVAIQAPPNAGTLNATGKLGVDVVGAVGFDIYSTVRNGTTERVEALASLTTANGSALYRINLFTGDADRVGSFRSDVVDIAIPLAQR